MAIQGVDYSWGRPDPRELFRLGKRFAVRYLSYDTSGKNLTKAEADRLSAAGLSIVSNWENAAGDQLGGYNRGAIHASEAARLHKACGGPAGRPIYFSVDFDASTSQLATCYNYLRGAASVIGWDRVGVYGGYRTINYMRDRGVKWLWQTYAWSSGQWAAGTHLQQYHNGVKLAGADTDLDRAMQTDYGQWGQDMPIDNDDVRKIWNSDGLVAAPTSALREDPGNKHWAPAGFLRSIRDAVRPRVTDGWKAFWPDDGPNTSVGTASTRAAIYARRAAEDVAALRGEVAGLTLLVQQALAGGATPLTPDQFSQLLEAVRAAARQPGEQLAAALAAAGEALADADGDDGGN
jgi:glycoside hydrolase-like protein